MSLKGKTAVITGTNSGIGLGVAHELARAGADVVLNSFTDRDEDHALAQEIADEAMDELDRLSRFLGRNPERKGSFEAHALLPSCLWGCTQNVIHTQPSQRPYTMRR